MIILIVSVQYPVSTWQSPTFPSNSQFPHNNLHPMVTISNLRQFSSYPYNSQSPFENFHPSLIIQSLLLTISILPLQYTVFPCSSRSSLYNLLSLHNNLHPHFAFHHLLRSPVKSWQSPSSPYNLQSNHDSLLPPLTIFTFLMTISIILIQSPVFSW